MGRDAPSRVRQLVRPSDVIFGINTTIFRARISRITPRLDHQVCSTGFCVLRPGPALDSEWLFCAVVSDEFLAQVTPRMRGASYPAVSDKDVLNCTIPVPPLAEQQRIVVKARTALDRLREIQMLCRESMDEAAELEGAVVLDCIQRFHRDNDVPLVPVSKVATVNPRRDSCIRLLDEDLEVTYVPMAAVDEETGTIADALTRPLGDVRKGFTPFLQGDVIFAKITPCMQNGKSAVVDSLVNGLGFGSTEFHVLRPGPEVLPEWLWYIVRQKSFRVEAQRHFRGSAGQQRVPASFIESHKIPLPTIDQQYRVVNDLQMCTDRVNSIRRSLSFNAVRNIGNRTVAGSVPLDLHELMQAVLRKAFAGEL